MSETKKIQSYSNDKLTVTFDPNVCTHSARCLRGLPGVFDIKRKRWVDVNAATPAQIVEQVRQCPSGALSVELHEPETPTAETATPPAEEPTVVITIVPTGSARIAGKVRIQDLDGNLILETEKCSLCRCGLSQKQPFCDGAHKQLREQPQP